jgi:hypothetical protein
MTNKNNFHDDNEPNEYWGSWMEVFALKIGVENILDFMKRLKPETDDINRLAEIEMSLISLWYMKEYFKRRAEQIDEILDNHPAHGNKLKNEDSEDYPHRHDTADWKPEIPDNIIPFKYKDTTNKRYKNPNN